MLSDSLARMQVFVDSKQAGTTMQAIAPPPGCASWDQWYVTWESYCTQVNGLQNEFNSPNGRVEALRKDLENLDAKLDAGGVGLEGTDIQFTSMRALIHWANYKVKPTASSCLNYGLFQDAISMLHGLAPGTVKVKDALKARHDVEKINVPSALAAHVLTSYSTFYPDIFGSDKDEAGEKFGTAMSTPAKWRDDNTRSGLEFTIRDRIKTEYSAIMNSIQQDLGDPDARELAKEMASRTRNFILNLVRFINEFFGEMRVAPSMTDAEAWELVLNMLAEIFREISKARSVVAHSRISEPSLHIWGALRAHEVMHRLESCDFRDDPTLNGILTRFVFKRKVDLDGLEAIKTRLTSVEGRVKGLDRDVKRKQDRKE
jgi:hypothetical protein